MNAVGSMPLTWVFATIASYSAFQRITPIRFQRIFHPALLATALLALILKLSHTNTTDYRAGGSVLSFFLGPAVVSLGLPLARLWPQMRRNLVRIATASLASAVSGILSVALILRHFGAESGLIKTLVTKSVTSPIAIAIIEKNGGIPELAATVILFVGVFGATVSVAIFKVFKIRNPGARGFALGASAHGIGMATAIAESDEAGAMAAIALALVGLATAIAIPALSSLGWL